MINSIITFLFWYLLFNGSTANTAAVKPRPTSKAECRAIGMSYDPRTNKCYASRPRIKVKQKPNAKQQNQAALDPASRCISLGLAYDPCTQKCYSTTRPRTRVQVSRDGAQCTGWISGESAAKSTLKKPASNLATVTTTHRILNSATANTRVVIGKKSTSFVTSLITPSRMSRSIITRTEEPLTTNLPTLGRTIGGAVIGPDTEQAQSQISTKADSEISTKDDWPVSTKVSDNGASTEIFSPSTTTAPAVIQEASSSSLKTNTEATTFLSNDGQGALNPKNLRNGLSSTREPALSASDVTQSSANVQQSSATSDSEPSTQSATSESALTFGQSISNNEAAATFTILETSSTSGTESSITSESRAATTTSQSSPTLNKNAAGAQNQPEPKTENGDSLTIANVPQDTDSKTSSAIDQTSSVFGAVVPTDLAPSAIISKVLDQPLPTVPTATGAPNVLSLVNDGFASIVAAVPTPLSLSTIPDAEVATAILSKVTEQIPTITLGLTSDITLPTLVPLPTLAEAIGTLSQVESLLPTNLLDITSNPLLVPTSLPVVLPSITDLTEATTIVSLLDSPLPTGLLDLTSALLPMSSSLVGLLVSDLGDDLPPKVAQITANLQSLLPTSILNLTSVIALPTSILADGLSSLEALLPSATIAVGNIATAVPDVQSLLPASLPVKLSTSLQVDLPGESAIVEIAQSATSNLQSVLSQVITVSQPLPTQAATLVNAVNPLAGDAESNSIAVELPTSSIIPIVSSLTSTLLKGGPSALLDMPLGSSRDGTDAMPTISLSQAFADLPSTSGLIPLPISQDIQSPVSNAAGQLQPGSTQVEFDPTLAASQNFGNAQPTLSVIDIVQSVASPLSVDLLQPTSTLENSAVSSTPNLAETILPSFLAPASATSSMTLLDNTDVSDAATSVAVTIIPTQLSLIADSPTSPTSSNTVVESTTGLLQPLVTPLLGLATSSNIETQNPTSSDQAMPTLSSKLMVLDGTVSQSTASDIVITASSTALSDQIDTPLAGLAILSSSSASSQTSIVNESPAMISSLATTLTGNISQPIVTPLLASVDSTSTPQPSAVSSSVPPLQSQSSTMVVLSVGISLDPPLSSVTSVINLSSDSATPSAASNDLPATTSASLLSTVLAPVVTPLAAGLGATALTSSSVVQTSATAVAPISSSAIAQPSAQSNTLATAPSASSGSNVAAPQSSSVVSSEANPSPSVRSIAASASASAASTQPLLTSVTSVVVSLVSTVAAPSSKTTSTAGNVVKTVVGALG